MTTKVPELFGSMVFHDEVMKERLPKDIYKALHKTMDEGLHLQLDLANVVAAAMKDWAVEKGATHYTHGARRKGHHGIFRKRAGKGRAGRFQFPFGRSAGYL